MEIVFPVMATGMFVAFLALVIVYGQKQRDELAAAWKDFAQRRGYTFSPAKSSWWAEGTPRVTGTVDNVTFELDTYIVSSGKSSTTYTRVRARAIAPAHSFIRVYNEHLFSGLGKALGFQDIELGDREFDDKFTVKSDRDEDARALLDAPTRQALTAFPRSLSFEYSAGEVDVHWVAMETEHRVLDAASRIVVAACRWRRDPEIYR